MGPARRHSRCLRADTRSLCLGPESRDAGPTQKVSPRKYLLRRRHSEDAWRWTGRQMAELGILTSVPTQCPLGAQSRQRAQLPSHVLPAVTMDAVRGGHVAPNARHKESRHTASTLR